MTGGECPADKSEDSSSKDRFIIEVEINRAGNSRRYRKPYVAVWVEDKGGYPVKTISLWLMKDRPGPRWHPDLKQWYRADRMRQLVEDKSLVDGMSSATRSPGKYKVAWDGTDDAGAALPAGKYTFYVEAAREHGTYQLIKHPIEIGKPIQETLKGNAEIKSVKLEYQVGTAK